MNITVLIGNLAADPSMNESRTMASFRLAVSKDTADGGADFINCKAFGKTAENLVRFKHKGDEIAVTGRISTGSYKNREGKNVYTTDVIANKIDFTRGSKSESTDAEPRSKGGYTDSGIAGMVNGDIPDSYEQLDDDLPF